jgi:hypothetical protein
MTEEEVAKKVAMGCAMFKGLQAIGTLALSTLFIGFMLFIFGFSIKTSQEYDCVISMAKRSREVVAVTGEPIEPGFFAWISYFESGGGVRQGHFSTSVSGPQGKGRVSASFYRTPVGSSLDIWFKTGGEEVSIYSGDYPCPER